MKLPNQRDIVLGDILVGADEGDLFVFLGKVNKTSRFAVKFHLSYTYFNSKFPHRRNAYVYSVGKITNNCVCRFRQCIGTIKEPNSGVSIKQIAARLHIILKIFKRRVKVIRHPKFTLCTAEFALFLLFRNRCFRGKGKNNRTRWYFGRHVNGQPVVGGYFYRLRNAHEVNIA